MKKNKFTAFLATALLCYLFWMLLTGQIVAIFNGGASLEVLLAGLVIAAAVGAFSARFFIHEEAFWLLRPKKFFCLIFYCLIIFPWELLKANWNMAKLALDPRMPINPGFVKIKSELKSEYGLAMLANSITLTPGTLSMDIAEKDGENYYYIHWIDVTTTDQKEAGDAIKGTLEKWIRRIWK